MPARSLEEDTLSHLPRLCCIFQADPSCCRYLQRHGDASKPLGRGSGARRLPPGDVACPHGAGDRRAHAHGHTGTHTRTHGHRHGHGDARCVRAARRGKSSPQQPGHPPAAGFFQPEHPAGCAVIYGKRFLTRGFFYYDRDPRTGGGEAAVRAGEVRERKRREQRDTEEWRGQREKQAPRHFGDG